MPQPILCSTKTINENFRIEMPLDFDLASQQGKFMYKSTIERPPNCTCTQHIAIKTDGKS